jgi:glycine/D-amino acid oxidase-like deaminating enzyme
LIGHRTTAELPEYAQVVVVGSGITGTSAVRWWSEKVEMGKSEDRRVLMLEAREACWGATGRVGLGFASISCGRF